MAKILLGVPAYGGNVRIEFAYRLIDAVMKLTQLGHFVAPFYTASASLIQKARNQFATIALNGDFSHLLMLDADLVFHSEDIVRLLEADLPIVGLNYALKYLDWEAIAEAARIGVPAKDLLAAGTVAVGREQLVPTGAMLIQRRVLEAFAAQPERWYPAPALAAKIEGLDRECDIFRAGVVDGLFMPEDFRFCREALELGFEAKILPANTAHIGNIAFEYRVT